MLPHRTLISSKAIPATFVQYRQKSGCLQLYRQKSGCLQLYTARYVDTCTLAINQSLNYGSGRTVTLAAASVVQFEYLSGSTGTRYVASGTLGVDQALDYSSGVTLAAKANTVASFTGSSSTKRYVEACALAGNQTLLYGSGKNVTLLDNTEVSFFSISETLMYVATGTLASDQSLHYSSGATLTAKANAYVSFSGTSGSSRYVDSCTLAGHQLLRYGYYGPTSGYALAELQNASTIRFDQQYVSEGTLSIDQNIYYGYFGTTLGRQAVPLKAGTQVRFENNYVLNGILASDQDLYYRSGLTVKLKASTALGFLSSSTSSYHYVIEGRLADAPPTQTLNYASGLTAQFKAGTMINFASTTNYVDLGTVGINLTINDINSGTSVVIAAGYYVEFQSVPAGATGWQLPPQNDADGDGWPDDIDPTPGSQDTDPNRHGTLADLPANALYVKCVGSAMQGIEVLGTPTSLVIPKGTSPRFVKIAIQTDEFPTWTSQTSQYNDTVSWQIAAPGQAVMSGNTSVNSLHYQLNSSHQSGTSFFGYAPVVVLDLGTIFADPAEDKTVNVALKVTNISDAALPTTAIVALLPIDIEEVISDQIAGDEANKLPTAYFGGNPAKPWNGHPNNPMLMATRSGSDARLMIKMNVPVAQAASIRVGVRQTGQTTILNSVASAALPGTTPLSFTALAGTQLYEIVAGFDVNGNAVLENSEASIIFAKTPKKDKESNPATANLHLLDKFRVVTQDDFNAARTTTDYHAEGDLVSLYPSAAGFLKAFARGATTVPGVPAASTTWGHVLQGSPIPSAQGLSHAVGGKWVTPANNVTTLRFEFPSNSDLAGDVDESAGIFEMIGRLLIKHKATLAAAATTTECVVPLSPITDDDINFKISDEYEQVHVALGACRFEGGLEVKVKKGAGLTLEVSEVNCWGAVSDLYDWGYDAPKLAKSFGIFGTVVLGEPREAATAWPDAGRVFFTKVNFGTGWRNREVTIP